MNNTVQKIKEQLLHEFKSGDRKGLYARTQKMMAYNSNKIEGSTLTSEQTASLFDTGSLYSEGEIVFRAKDIEEMTGHFMMFNHMLKTIDEPLTEELIKEFHFKLKSGVFEDMANGYKVGAYKTRSNSVSDIKTTAPGAVADEMKVLLEGYNNKKEIQLYDLLKFHADFEQIHPFQDGNGRVGRIILFRECLRKSIVPVIIKDETKMKYYAALHKLQINKDPDLFLKYAAQEQNLYLAETEGYLLEHENYQSENSLMKKLNVFKNDIKQRAHDENERQRNNMYVDITYEK